VGGVCAGAEEKREAILAKISVSEEKIKKPERKISPVCCDTSRWRPGRHLNWHS
jgi:hypothetical protein